MTSHAQHRALVVADIGGTNARFALATPEGAAFGLSQISNYHCGSAQGLGELLCRYLRELGDSRPERACLAIAGPNDGRQGFVTNLGTFGSMGWILWQHAGPVSFELGGGTVTVPGYLFWVAIGWGLLQTVATHRAGHTLAGATVVQQATEADFRFALAKVRDSAEQVALYRGNAVEQQRLMRLFDAIRANWAR